MSSERVVIFWDQSKVSAVIVVSAKDAMTKPLKRKADAFLLFDDKSNERMKPYYYLHFVK